MSDLRVGLTMDLGVIELAADEVVRMREGAHYSFGAPPFFEVTLRIDGAPWAKAHLVMQEGTCRLEITEMLMGSGQNDETKFA